MEALGRNLETVIKIASKIQMSKDVEYDVTGDDGNWWIIKVGFGFLAKNIWEGGRDFK